MVYLPRAVNSTCIKPLPSDNDKYDEVELCRETGNRPYCWPSNGTRICWGDQKRIDLYWPPKFYNKNASLSLDVGNLQNGEKFQSRSIGDASKGGYTLTNFEPYSERIPDSGERILRIRIREQYHDGNAMTSVALEGPTLTIVPWYDPTATATATATAPTWRPRVNPSGDSAKQERQRIAGIVIGAIFGAIAVLVLMCFCCNSCCLWQSRREVSRVKRQEARRVQQERAAVQPQVDEIRASVAQGVLWTGPVRPGGMWAAELPSRASRSASRPASRTSDEIRVISVVEEQRAEEHRIEVRRQATIQETRQETRPETGMAEEVEPPPYEAPPPKYTP